MSVAKKRLGRGLDYLIAGGVGKVSSKESDRVAVKEVKKSVFAEGSEKKSTVKPTKATLSTRASRRGGQGSGKRDFRRKGVFGLPATAKPQEADGLSKGGDFYEIPISKIETNPYQPRREIDSEQIKDLAESIRSEGLLQPIVVRRVKDNYQLIAGERRYRACQDLKIKSLPARVIEASDASSAVMSLIENLQREDLNPLEEAFGYASLIRDFDLTQEGVAERVGKSRATVANALRLLQLESEIKDYLSKGFLSVGHAKVILGVEDSSQRLLLARRIIETDLSVRELERIIRNFKGGKPSARKRQRSEVESTAIRALEKQLSLRLNTCVQVKHSPRRGKILIEYYGNDDLQRILERLGLNA